MPSPFPGMDPYLEGDLWTSVHAMLATEIVRQLAPKLRPRYVALPQKRYIMVAADAEEADESSRYPDVGVRDSGIENGNVEQTGTITPSVIVATIISDPEPHIWIEIRVAKKGKLVTAIEILSPTNKKGKGRAEYLEKRDEYLHSSAHLIEIDLVRQGRSVPMKKRLPPAPYYVFLSRAGRRPLTEVWPIAWDQPLPTVSVPLLKPDADVPLDLQQTMNEVYDLAGLDLAVDYSGPPDVVLPPKVQRWADKVLGTIRKKK